MSNYIIRLDDASEYMDLEKWSRMERLLDKHNIKPIFGIIPDNKDESIVSKYKKNSDFWSMVHGWIDKGWIPAMHGYEHRYVTSCGGINPVNKRSEFAGLPYDEQAEKIRKGWGILNEHGIKPNIFFAPSHTFDENTLKAIKEETSIRIISDTIAWDVYKKEDFWFIPQQSGRVRKLPFKTVTFCYHPNTMNDNCLNDLEHFVQKNKKCFVSYKDLVLRPKPRYLIDCLLSKLYFRRHIRQL